MEKVCPFHRLSTANTVADTLRISTIIDEGAQSRQQILQLTSHVVSFEIVEMHLQLYSLIWRIYGIR